MSTLAQILAGQAGVVRVRADAREVAAELEAAGWRTGVVRGAADKARFLGEVGRALDLPRWYGRNLDALWDCLTDLTGPTALVWSGWEEMAVNHPRDWAALRGLLGERVDEEPEFALVLVATGRRSGVSP
ncbi:hypothetical protein GCM10027418_15050 [Mariniluteicoccus endophyticus]